MPMRNRGSNAAFGVTFHPRPGGSGSIEVDVEDLVEYGDGSWEVSFPGFWARGITGSGS